MAISEQRLYVYLQLPQSLDVATAGLYELDSSSGVETGSFFYNPTYLARADAVPLEPFELPRYAQLARINRFKIRTSCCLCISHKTLKRFGRAVQ